MSEVVLSQNKLLCFFHIDPNLPPRNKDPLFIPDTLPLLVHHHHYPSAIYPILFSHFALHFAETVKEGHLRLRYKGQQLPPEWPVGLTVQQNSQIEVGVGQSQLPSGFQQLVNSWKRGYTIVNEKNRCDHIFQRLSEQQLLELYKIHLQGKSHGLHKIPTYEGNRIALRLILKEHRIERLQSNLTLTVKQYLTKQFGDILGELSCRVETHGVEVDVEMNLKELLEEWNYNDGFCYLKITFPDVM